MICSECGGRGEIGPRCDSKECPACEGAGGEPECEEGCNGELETIGAWHHDGDPPHSVRDVGECRCGAQRDAGLYYFGNAWSRP